MPSGHRKAGCESALRICDRVFQRNPQLSANSTAFPQALVRLHLVRRRPVGQSASTREDEMPCVVLSPAVWEKLSGCDRRLSLPDPMCPNATDAGAAAGQANGRNPFVEDTVFTGSAPPTRRAKRSKASGPRQRAEASNTSRTRASDDGQPQRAWLVGSVGNGCPVRLGSRDGAP